MAVELVPLGITVNGIAPGPVDTDQSRGTHTEATCQAYREADPGRPLRRTPGRSPPPPCSWRRTNRASSMGHILNVDGGFDAAGLMFDPEAAWMPRLSRAKRAGPTSLREGGPHDNRAP